MTARVAGEDPGTPPILRERPVGSCAELVFVSGSALCASPWNAPAGAVLRSAGQIVALHFAPGRWLLLDAALDLLAAGVRAGGVAIDVEGKWRCLEIRGARADAVLAAGVDPGLILEGRECAAAPIFDCPTVIVARPRDDGFDVCVHASYATGLRASLQSVLDRAEGPR